MHLIWLRTDLRLHDNTALAAASQRGPIAAVYLITPERWLAQHPVVRVVVSETLAPLTFFDAHGAGLA